MKIHAIRNIRSFLTSKQLTIQGDQIGPLVDALQELAAEEQAELAKLDPPQAALKVVAKAEGKPPRGVQIPDDDDIPPSL